MLTTEEFKIMVEDVACNNNVSMWNAAIAVYRAQEQQIEKSEKELAGEYRRVIAEFVSEIEK